MKTKYKFSIWIINGRFYLWSAKKKRYFKWHYKTLAGAEVVQINLQEGNYPSNYQMISHKNLKDIEQSDRF